MWQCDNCGYTDEDGSSFEEDLDAESGEKVRYCPECGSDEVYQVDEDEPDDNDLSEDEVDDEDEDEEWSDEEEPADREEW